MKTGTRFEDRSAAKARSASKNIRRAAKMQRLLERIAYYSIFIDFGITIVTLISINEHISLHSITLLLNIMLSAVVIVSMVLFAIIFFLSHYDKIIDRFALRYANNTGSKKERRRGRRI
ncbi:MAG: hypothetical protein ACP5UH_00280 [Candidatus Micrarchaeia archaeon]